MKEIKVLGTGCANCKATITLIEQVAGAKATPIKLEKVQEMQDIISYGVMSTPAVVISLIYGKLSSLLWIRMVIPNVFMISIPVPLIQPLPGIGGITMT